LKLVLCSKCQDIFKLERETRKCKCGRCYGKYEEDGLHAIVSKDCICIGIDNNSIVEGLRKYYSKKDENLGPEITTWIFTKKAKNIKWEESGEW